MSPPQDSVIIYTVGAIPLPIARQIMAALTATQILAKLTPTDEQYAAIDVALFDRPELDRLLAPYEAVLRATQALLPDLPFADLHTSVLGGAYTLGSGSADHDAFTGWLISYQTSAADSAKLEQLADGCNRRIARAHLPLDLIAAYSALARLARWRAEQLRGAL